MKVIKHILNCGVRIIEQLEPWAMFAGPLRELQSDAEELDADTPEYFRRTPGRTAYT